MSLLDLEGSMVMVGNVDQTGRLREILHGVHF